MNYDSPTSLSVPLKRELNLTATQFCSLYSAYSAPNVFLPLFFGYLTDRAGARYSRE